MQILTLLSRKRRDYPIGLSVFLFLILAALSVSDVTCTEIRPNLILYEQFNNNVGKLIAHPALENHGGSVVQNGKLGKALWLPNGAHAALKAPKGLSAYAGTISFWVKPLWDKDDKSSHTFLSMRWDDDRDSYLAVSQGWWEPTGAGRLYFILSNQEIMHCSLPYHLNTDYWTKITVTWQGGSTGYCRLFVDGEKVAEHMAAFSGRYGAKRHIFLGSDRGSTVQRNRNAGFLMSELSILDRPMSEAEVLRNYEDEEQDPIVVLRKKRHWLDELLSKVEESRLYGDGKQANVERRVIFDEDIQWATSKEATDLIIESVKEAGFNVYAPCVWHGRGTAYPSKVAYRESRLKRVSDAGYDPLAYLLQKAHSEGIEVHPWFTVVRREDTHYRGFYDSGTPPDAFDVHNEKFRQFIVDLMLDVVKRYPVDGVNLDYIRSMGDCTSERCQAEYEGIFKRSLLQDIAEKTKPGQKTESLDKWHLEAVGQIVQNFVTQAKALNPGLVISVDAVPLDPYLQAQGQDSVLWANSGWVDVIYSMDYGKEIDVAAVERVRKVLREPERLTLLVSTYDLADKDLIRKVEQGRITEFFNGKAVVAREPALLADYVRLSRRFWPGSGLAFYHYKQLTQEQGRVLRETVFRQTVSARPFARESATEAK